MKTLTLALLMAVYALGLRAQPLQFRSAAEPTPTPITGDQTTWKRVVTYMTPYGKTVYLTNQYQQLGSGLNFLVGNAWAPSRAEFELFENGAIGRHSQHQVICSPNANSTPMLDAFADGKRFRTRVMGVIYAEPGQNGRSVMVAETQDSIGQLIPPNQILYPDAFDSEDGIHADLIIIYTKAGWEQNLVFRTQPPDPAAWGLQNARIELWTEQLFDTPEPIIRAAVAPSRPNAVAEDAASDPDAAQLDFGGTVIGAGTAFLTGVGQEDAQRAATVEISKAWIATPQNRRFLIEAAPFSKLKPLLLRLPLTAAVNSNTNELLMASRSGRVRRALPPREVLKNGGPGSREARPTITKPVTKGEFAANLSPPVSVPKTLDQKIQLAKLDSSARSGVTMDYSQFTVSTNLTNFILKASETYFIADQCNFFGTTVIEPTVVKFTNSTSSNHAKLFFEGPVVCATDPYHPAVFCGKDDDVYGEQIAGSSHNPGTTIYGEHYLSLAFTADTTGGLKLHDIVLRNASIGIHNPQGRNMVVDNAQFISCDFGLLNKETFTIRNALFYNVNRPFYGQFTNAVTVCEHLTVHKCNGLIYGSTLPDLLLTNSLLISVTGGVRYAGANVQTNLDDTGIFVSAGHGAHYLPILSPYRGAGNTNVSTNVIASLQMRTTTAPIILSNNVDRYPILSPVVPRGYSTAPDLGFATVPIDFLLRGVVLNTNTLLLTNGVTVAIDCSYTNFGFLLGTNGSLISDSDPLHLNHIVRTRAIQELALADKSGSATFAEVNVGVPNAVLRLRFTDLPLQSGDLHVSDSHGTTAFRELTFEDCQLRGGSFYLSSNGGTNFLYNFWNNLLERVGIEMYPYTYGGTFQARNNLFVGGWLSFVYVWDGIQYSLHDNLFDKTSIQVTSVSHDYNAYLSGYDRLTPTNIALNDVILTNSNVSYQTGLLSHYFLPTNSPLIDAGSQTADYSGLYWYCSCTNQVVETNSRVNIGLHFIALGTNNLPLDGDLDNLSSFREDSNGNGSLEPDETNPNNAATFSINDYVLVTQGRSYKTNSALPDTNNLMRFQVYTPLK